MCGVDIKLRVGLMLSLKIFSREFLVFDSEKQKIEAKSASG